MFKDKSRDYETEMRFSNAKLMVMISSARFAIAAVLSIMKTRKLLLAWLRSGERKILLCKRNIEPRKGYWTLPAGFMEQRETTQQAAAREAYEEARADIEVGDLLAIYNIARISQVQIFYRGKLTKTAG